MASSWRRRQSSPTTPTYWMAEPKVYTPAPEASLSWLANQANAVNTITSPIRFSGRARHETSPQPSSDAPTNSVRAAPGPVVRSAGWWAASHTAPAPARTPRPAIATSLFLIAMDCGRNRAPPQTSLGGDRREHVEVGGAAGRPGGGEQTEQRRQDQEQDQALERDGEVGDAVMSQRRR